MVPPIKNTSSRPRSPSPDYARRYSALSSIPSTSHSTSFFPQNATASSSRVPLSPQPNNTPRPAYSGKLPLRPFPMSFETASLPHTPHYESPLPLPRPAKRLKTSEESVFSGLAGELKKQREQKKSKSTGTKGAVSAKPNKKSALPAALQQAIDLQSAFDEAKEAKIRGKKVQKGKKGKKADKAREGSCKKDEPINFDDDAETDHDDDDIALETSLNDDLENLDDGELAELLDEEDDDSAEFQIPVNANIRSYITVPPLPSVPTPHDDIFLARFTETDSRMLREAPLSGLWRRILTDLSPMEKYAIVRDRLNEILLAVLCGKRPPTALHLLGLKWKGDGWICYLKLAIAKKPGHKDMVYAGSASSCPQWFGAPYGADKRRAEHEKSIAVDKEEEDEGDEGYEGSKGAAKSKKSYRKNNYFDNVMRSKPDDRTVEFVTAYHLPVDFANATRRQLMDKRLRIIYIEGVLHEMLQTWLDTNPPPNIPRDTSYWAVSQYTYFGTNWRHPLDGSMIGISTDNYRLTRREVLDRRNAKKRWRYHNEPRFKEKTLADGSAWKKKKRRTDPVWTASRNAQWKDYIDEPGMGRREKHNYQKRENRANASEVEKQGASDQKAKWSEDNHEHVLTYAKNYRDGNREAVRATNRSWKADHREYTNARQRLQRRIDKGEATAVDMVKLKKKYGMLRIKGVRTPRPKRTKAYKEAQAAAKAKQEQEEDED